MPAERANGQELAGALIPPIVIISLFVLATTTGLAVNLRRRRFARLRTIGATRGQVRRAILAELAGCGTAGGALGLVPGIALGVLGAHALAAHQMLPAGSAAWLSPWLLPIACGTSAVVARLSGQVAARRGSRTSPAQAVTLLAVTRAATGSWAPFIPAGPTAALIAAVAALTAGAVMVPFRAMSRREPALGRAQELVRLPSRARSCRSVNRVATSNGAHSPAR